MTEIITDDPRPRESHIFAREANDHYVEEVWCSRRLFGVEEFHGPILDPACGWGRILDNAQDLGLKTYGSDVVDRGASVRHPFKTLDFLGDIIDGLDWWRQGADIVCNPPFDLIEGFARRALFITSDFLRAGKVAFIFPLRRLPAATWLRETPLKRILYMNPRPSMPTGAFIEAAERGDINPKTGKPCKVGGGTQDFCWVIWEHGWTGEPSVGWLSRENR